MYYCSPGGGERSSPHFLTHNVQIFSKTDKYFLLTAAWALWPCALLGLGEGGWLGLLHVALVQDRLRQLQEGVLDIHVRLEWDNVEICIRYY